MKNKPTILFKYPSRNRKERFFISLDSLYNNMADPENFRCAITLDSDDPVMSHPEVVDRISSYPNTIISFGSSENKVHAINRDLPEYGDIIVVWSDDMICTFYGFDEIIRSCFQDGFDWHVHLPDLDEGDKIPVLYIAGRLFYNRWGWIYNPVYKSLFCDTELMDIAKEQGLYKFFNYPGLFVHMLPSYGRQEADSMWKQQQEIGWSIDKETYLMRKSIRLNDSSILTKGL